MTIVKMRLTLEIAYDLVAKVQSAICNSGMSREEGEDISKDTMRILRQIIYLGNKLEGVERND